MRFYPDISPVLKAFNSGNGTYYLFARPSESTGMIQYNILNTTGKTKEEIYDMLLEEEIKMVYFTGGFMTNTGQGYSDIGKHTYTFKIKDVINH